MDKRGDVSRLAAALLPLLLLMAPLQCAGAGPAAPGLAFRDDFDYAPGWKVVEGTWRHHDALLNGSGQDARTLAGDPNWVDVNISVRLRLVSGDGGGILFRANSASYGENNGRYYQLVLSRASGAVLTRVAMGAVALRSAPLALSLGTWYSVTVLVNGSDVSCLVNGSPILNYTNLELLPGQVGLKASASVLHFDDFVVRGSGNGTVLLSDDFPSSPTGGWDPGSGTWYFEGGDLNLISTGERGDYILAPVEAPGPLWTARARLMWTAGSYFETGIHFNFNGPGSGYLALLSAFDSTLRIQRAENGSVNDRWVSKPFPVKKSEWYTMTIVSNGSALELYMNSALLLSRTDPSPLPGRGFALGSWSGAQERVRFSYFEVVEGLSPPRPDLSINLSSLEIYPDRPNPGDEVVFKFGVDNFGTMDAAGNIAVEVLAGGVQLAVSIESSMPAGRTHLVFLHWLANLSGNLSLTFSVDRCNQIEELDETNNNASWYLVVNVPPRPILTMTPEDGRVEIEQETYFNASSSFDPDGTIASFHWDFGDRTGASVPVTSHRYQREGTYRVTLNVTDDGGCSRTSSATVRVSKRSPTAGFSWSPAHGNVSTVFIFRYELHDPDGTASGWLWDFGDGNTTTDQAPAHRYADDSAYIVTFTLRYNNNLNSSSTSREIVVENTPPSAQVTSAPAQLLKGQEGLFSASASDIDDPIDSLVYVWSFGDGTCATGPETLHSYSRSGTYRVCLIVTDDDGDNVTLYHSVKVPNLPPEAVFAPPPPGYLNDSFLFDATFSRDPDGAILNLSWSFGDGTVGYGEVVSHSYASPGNYTVTLTVVDDEGASNSSTALVWVRELPEPPPAPRPAPSGPPLAQLGAAAAVSVALIAALMAWSRMRRGAGGGPPRGDAQGPGGAQG
ncbi:MAG: PKD domain-containing protein [Thermoplasmatota archaeon]